MLAELTTPPLCTDVEVPMREGTLKSSSLELPASSSPPNKPLDTDFINAILNWRSIVNDELYATCPHWDGEFEEDLGCSYLLLAESSFAAGKTP